MMQGSRRRQGDTETRQQKARREMQHPIYFEASKCNTCNIRVKTEKKYLKCASETLVRTLETIANISNIQIKHMQHLCETYARSR
jgi:hypothetical protein